MKGTGNRKESPSKGVGGDSLIGYLHDGRGIARDGCIPKAAVTAET